MDLEKLLEDFAEHIKNMPDEELRQLIECAEANCADEMEVML